jgi:hypothetical protein
MQCYQLTRKAPVYKSFLVISAHPELPVITKEVNSLQVMDAPKGENPEPSQLALSKSPCLDQSMYDRVDKGGGASRCHILLGLTDPIGNPSPKQRDLEITNERETAG